MFDITALGELLIDFTYYGQSENGMSLFERNPGGAVANVLCAAVRFNRTAAFLGKVGDDMHGQFLRDTLRGAGVNTDGLVTDGSVFTTLAFVALSENGERSFSFARKPGADTCLRESELNAAVLSHTRVLHIGSLSLTHEPARSATFAAIGSAKRSGALISYDPNYRASLWPSVEEARTQMRSVVPYADLMKLSDEETELLTGFSDPERAAEALESAGVKCTAVTLGAEGALVRVEGRSHRVPSFKSRIVDTTGAGDAFWGAFLSRFLASDKRMADMTLTDAAEFARWGCAAASCCIEKRGAIPAMPTEEEAAARMNGQ